MKKVILLAMIAILLIALGSHDGVMSAPTSAIAVDSIASASTPSPTATPTPIYHTGDLIVEGNETRVIENVTLFIDGNIIVKDRSTLMIRNSTIILQLKFFGEYWVEVRDNSRLLVDNATLERVGRYNTLFMVRPGSEAIIKNAVCGWDIADGGKIILENYDSTSASNGIFFNRGRITAVNSKFNIISIPVRGNQKSTLELNEGCA